MKEITFGTSNPAKVLQIRSVLSPAGIEVFGIEDKSQLPDVVEDGKTASENAKKKAFEYAKALKKIVFAMDNALYLDGLTPDKQPGIHVRRMNGTIKRPTDNDMIRYYSKLIKSLGGKVGGYWEYGICIASPEGEYKETVIKAPRIFVSDPSEKIEKGYPLESLQIEPASGRYMSEFSREEIDVFWQKTIGKPLLKFVQSVEF